MEFVDVEHPLLGRARVPAVSVQHLNSDWKTAGPVPGEFDPAQHNADDVLAYLDTASAEEAARVLSAEQGGKARVSVLRFEAPDPTDTTAAPSVAAPPTSPQED